MDGSLVRSFIMPLVAISEINDTSDITWFEEILEKEKEKGVEIDRKETSDKK